MSATIVNGRKIAETLKHQVKKEISSLQKKTNIPPHVITLLVGSNKASEMYLTLREKACAQVGITASHQRIPHTITQPELEQIITGLNTNSSIHGIMIQLPLPEHLDMLSLYNKIDPKKDVEGLSPYNLGSTFAGKEHLVPCTPQAVLTILNHLQISLQGKEVCVINHSLVVGKPLGMMLLHRNATVSICHVYTENVKAYTQKADILIPAAGVIDLVTADHIKPGAIVIDVGINPTKKGVQGDVAFEKVQEKASVLTPVPGGVGPVTIACCLQNIVKTYRMCVLSNE